MHWYNKNIFESACGLGDEELEAFDSTEDLEDTTCRDCLISLRMQWKINAKKMREDRINLNLSLQKDGLSLIDTGV